MTIKSFFLILLTVSAFSFSFSPASAGSILRNADGSVRRMNWFEATGVNPDTAKKENPDACKKAGKGRLTTARELAMLAKSRGAKGILEMSQVDPEREAAGDYFMQGYFLKSTINPDGKRDQFYYSAKGYTPPADKDEQLIFAVSSIDTTYYWNTFFFDGYAGYMEQEDEWNYSYSGLAVRCTGK
jgi:hypothetical protein